MKGQLQSLEPVLIVIVLGVLLGVGLLFMVRLGDSQAGAERSIVEERAAIALLREVSSLPELSCPASETVETFCIDKAKAEAFVEMMGAAGNRTLYYPLLGPSSIELTWIDPVSGPQDLTLYDALTPGADTLGSTTYFTVHDPVRDERLFAMITVRRQVS